MIKAINFIKYKKFENQSISFSPHVNLISGTNGTCKTTLLHIVSNSFQAITGACAWIEADFLKILKGVNHQINPKMENLARGDKKFNDPASGIKGNLFGVSYFNSDAEQPLEFRRHNTRNSDTPRYYIKPQYKEGRASSLPFCPVIYLSLSRLLPFGEYENDDDIKLSKIKLPESYMHEACEIYKDLTGLSINTITTQKMGGLKTRMEFISEQEGVDSNTISSGEDNLSVIINAMLSLKYYYEISKANLGDNDTPQSVLLIDEIDATLHPSVQNKLLKKLKELSEESRVQVFATTHSLSLLEYAFQHKQKVIYFVNNVLTLKELDSPDIYKIKMHLSQKNHAEIYKDKSLPIYTEDQEARDLIELLFSYQADIDQSSNKADGFHQVRRFYHLVKANLGAENLRNIFEDRCLQSSTIQAICILDGDKSCDSKDFSNKIICLPGGQSPENFLIEYALNLYNSKDTKFWDSDDLINQGYSKQYFLENIKSDIEANKAKIEAGAKQRELNKRFYSTHKDFLLLIFGEWLKNPINTAQINKFFRNLNILFKKTAPLHDINPHNWTFDESK
ncbi:MAG: AAA family ATPase [Methylophilus sp.]|uniref:AAA family ATPase n=1 Tax=Methylophilus sp. TaxID=29541 RepID=UPI003FA0DCDB